MISAGQRAEIAVADRLSRQGYKIIDRNWKTKLCEIDIIAQKDQIIYFVEVKYRRSNAQGSGFSHVTNSKQRQLLFAIDLWTAQNSWSGDCRLLAAEVSGEEFDRIEVVEA